MAVTSFIYYKNIADRRKNYFSKSRCVLSIPVTPTASIFVSRCNQPHFSPSRAVFPTSNKAAFHSSSELAAAKRSARGRGGGRSTGRGRVRSRSTTTTTTTTDLQDKQVVPPSTSQQSSPPILPPPPLASPAQHHSNGKPPNNNMTSTSTSFMFANATVASSSSTSNVDDRRELLLRRLNEISLRKRQLEQCQNQSSSPDNNNTMNGSSSINNKNIDIDNDSQSSIRMNNSNNHNNSRNNHSNSSHINTYKPRSSNSGLSSMPPLDISNNNTNTTATGRKKPIAPAKRRRGEQPSSSVNDNHIIIDTPHSKISLIDLPETDTVQQQRNGKHHHISKSSKHQSGASKSSPPVIDLDSLPSTGGIGASTKDLSPEKGGAANDRSRGRSTSSGGYVNSSPQGSPTLSSRGSGRVRTPSVLLSSQPGEKMVGNGGNNPQSSKNKQVSYCLRLIKELIRLKDGYAFSRPINELWSIEQLPGYFDVVKHPMDLGTIRNRLEGNHYIDDLSASVDHFDLDTFQSDVRLVFDNAKTYNRPGDMFYESASKLMEKFDSKMKQLPVPPSKTADHSSHIQQTSGAATATTNTNKKSKKRKKGSSSSVPVGFDSGSGAIRSHAHSNVQENIQPSKKGESSKKRKLGSSKSGGGASSRMDRDENGKTNRTSKKKPPIPSGSGNGINNNNASGGKSRGGSGGNSKKKRASGSNNSKRNAGNNDDNRKDGSSKNNNQGDNEVVEVPKHQSSSLAISEETVDHVEIRLRALKRQRLLMESGIPPSSPPAGSSTSYMARAQALYHVEMTFEEKVQLSNNVGKLPADKLQKIVALATKNKSSSMEVNHNEEIELDIDSMNNETLREMEAYVNQILSKKGKKGSSQSNSALKTSPNADILSMSASQIEDEIRKVTQKLRKMSGGKSKELVQDDQNDGNSNADGGGSGSKRKKKSFYDTDDSSSDSDSDDGSGSESSDDSSSEDSDSEDEDESDEETTRKRRERNLAHQQAMQATGTPLPSPGYQSSQRSS